MHIRIYLEIKEPLERVQKLNLLRIEMEQKLGVASEALKKLYDFF